MTASVYGNMTKKKKILSNKRNYCEYCDKIVIGSSYKYKSHLFKHNAVEPRFKCKYCSKAYYRYDTFARHEKSHTSQASIKVRHICDYCDRGFVNKYNLIVHLKKIHDDSINPDIVGFSCKACGIRYCEKRILLNHIRKLHFNIELSDEPSHLNKSLNESWIERVNSTDTCVQITKVNNNVITIKRCAKIKEFSDKKNSKKKNVYGNQFIDQYSKAICDYCKKEMVKKSLKNHIRERHLNIRNFKCMECERSFKRHYQLVDHKCGQDGRQSKKL